MFSFIEQNKFNVANLLRTTTTALLTDYTACCPMEYNIVLFTMLYYNLVDAQLSQLGLQGENEKN